MIKQAPNASSIGVMDNFLLLIKLGIVTAPKIAGVILLKPGANTSELKIQVRMVGW